MIGRGTGRHRPVRPSPAGCPRWLRRALLVGTAGAGLWLAGSLGHAGSAEASPLPPIPGGLAGVTQQLPSLAADRTVASPHSPAGTLLRTAPATLRSAGGRALTGLVPAVVGTTTGPLGSTAPAVSVTTPALPVAAPALPVSTLPALPTGPLTLPLLGEPPALAGLIGTPELPVLGRQLPFGPVLLGYSARAAVPAPSGATRQDRSPARVDLPSTPRPAMPVGTPPAGGTAGSSVAAMALLAPDGCRSGSPVGPPSRLARRTPATRERASAPVVWPG